MQKSSAMTPFQKNIRLLLSARGFSYRDFERQSGFAPATISRIVNGHESCTIERAEKIANALGVTLSDLLNENLGKILSASS